MGDEMQLGKFNKTILYQRVSSEHQSVSGGWRERFQEMLAKLPQQALDAAHQYPGRNLYLACMPSCGGKWGEIGVFVVIPDGWEPVLNHPLDPMWYGSIPFRYREQLRNCPVLGD